jgi:hypothetical protein
MSNSAVGRVHTPGMTHHRRHHITLIDRFLEGRIPLAHLERELVVAADRAAHGTLDVLDALGMTAAELAALSREPGALRYILHARRFGIPLAHVLRSDLDLAASEAIAAARLVDPRDVAELEAAHASALHDATQHRMKVPADA